jgi:outer membrane protein assembly factor BamB
MRYLGQRSITVDDDRVYACTAQGRLVCLRSGNGALLWEKEYHKDLGGKEHYMLGYADAPLIEGDLLICAPGGSGGTLAGLNKKTGVVVWRSSELKDPMPHSAIVPCEIGGVRQVVVATMKSIAGIAVKDGRLRWRADFEAGSTQLAATPIVREDLVLINCGYAVGWHAYKLSAQEEKTQAEPLYSGKQTGYHRSVTAVGDRVYACAGGIKCFDLRTGEMLWGDRGGSGAVLAADGLLIVRNEYEGVVQLVDPGATAPRARGQFVPPERSREGGYSQAILAGGRLYLRDLDNLYCYDLRGPEYREPPPVWRIKLAPPAPPAPDPGKGTDAAFVPTPMDVVEKMIDAANLTRDDVVYDLGSGDGRIVLAASRIRGCKSVGFEIHPGLVAESRLQAKRQKLDDLVTIEEKDLFTVDLQPASVVMLYLGAPNNAKLLPQLRKLKPGSRIVSHAHLLGDAGPKPDRTLKIVSKDDQVEHEVHVWTTPLKESR